MRRVRKLHKTHSLEDLAQAFPRLGKLTAPVYMVLDPVVDRPGINVPFSRKQAEWFINHVKHSGGFTREDVCIISCAPSVDHETWGLASKTTAHLKQYHDAFVKLLNTTKPKLILPFGAKACQQVMGRSVQITKARGQVVSDPDLYVGVPVLPMLSPFYAQRQPENEAAFAADLNTAKRIANADFDPEAAILEYKHDYSWCYDLQFLIDMKPKSLSVDCETLGLDWFRSSSRVLTVQLCWEAGKSVCVPIEYSRGKLPHHRAIDGFDIKLANKKKLVRQLKVLLENKDTKVFGQNFKFDWLMLKYQLDIEVANYSDDTMLMAHLLDENTRRINLDDLVRRYVPSMAGFNDIHNVDPNHHGKSRMDLLPPETMLEYGCNDTTATWLLRQELHKRLSADKKLLQCYNKVSMPAQRAFCHVEPTGFSVSVKRLKDFEVMLRKRQRAARLYLLRQIPKSIKDEYKDTGVGLKVTRGAILRAWLYEHKDGLKLKPVLYTKTKLPSISSKNALPYYVADHPVLLKLTDYIKDDKLLNTYVKGFYKYIQDGKIRPSYMLASTVTGRSACLHKDTLVTTFAGEKRAADIKVGDLLFTHKRRWKPVVELFIKPAEEMYEVVLTNGESVTCTEGHIFYTANHKWETLRNVCIKSTLSRPVSAGSGGKRLYEIFEDSQTGIRRYGNDTSHSNSNIAGRTRTRQIQTVQDSQIFSIEDRQQEPGQGKAFAQLEGQGLRRLLWVSDTDSGRAPLLCASLRNGQSFRGTCEGLTEIYGDTPHRREPAQQPVIEPSGCILRGASGDPSEVSVHPAGIGIAEVYYRGSHRVFDFEVADDHSYEAGGVFSHNSKNPNGQNFPKRGKLAKEYRTIFEAPKGFVYVQVDLSQAELRIAAMMSQDLNMLEVYAQGGDIHRATAAGTMGITLEEFMQLPKAEQDLKRFRAKAVNFGFIYGMWWPKFRSYAKTDYGIEFTDDEAREIRENFFITYPALSSWHDTAQGIAMQNGQIRTYDGRLRHLPNVFSPDEGISKAALRQAINAPVQAIASDLGLMALGRLIPFIRRKGYGDWIKPCGFIHDAIVCLVREDKAAEGVYVVKHFMESNPLTKWFDWTPEIPIIADAEIGRNLSRTYELPTTAFMPKDTRGRSYRDLLMLEVKGMRAKRATLKDSDKIIDIDKQIHITLEDANQSVRLPSRRRIKQRIL